MIVLLVLGCAGGDGTNADTTDSDGPDFGGVAIALDAPCADIAGLTGQAVLDRRIDGYASTLEYVTPHGGFVDPTALTLAITWPASPTATCYPPWDEAPLYAAAERVGTAAPSHVDPLVAGSAPRSRASKPAPFGARWRSLVSTRYGAAVSTGSRWT